ncbi:hypothetical protein FYK55_01805 [Roseiconus nitratireducens]|uniref:RNA polymerase sigma-70 ECF-like HTH domain-containing protein n=1 Tax=Roseiconus nitratireducens TaxID=2605748 RepID=A0A5M6DHZ0_9BACT|nr:ECF-type sigma factor [Roseiconus nitratireducens]KAA5547168.1 hypothetical protein FYK55_01805 [Roseiconus nitratireducens]
MTDSSSHSSVTQILRQLRNAADEEARQVAAEKLHARYRLRVERVARGRLPGSGGLADEQDVAQSAFRSFFDRIETGQLDALVSGGQAWAILAKLTKNKAIDSVRYDNAKRRGGDGARRVPPAERFPPVPPTPPRRAPGMPAASEAGDSQIRSPLRWNEDEPESRETPFAGGGESIEHSQVSLDAVRDRAQRPVDEQLAYDEVLHQFLEQLSEATLRGIVRLKLQGFTNDEIADKLGCATRTVERKLNLIRRLWIPILEDRDERAGE